MSERGKFVVDRGIWSHPMFDDPTGFSRREVFLWMISAAEWRLKGSVQRINGCYVRLRRGQLSFSLRFISEKVKWHSEARVRRYLSELKRERMIDATVDAGRTVITICNYNKYQFIGEFVDAAVDAGATQERRKEEERTNKSIKEGVCVEPAIFEFLSQAEKIYQDAISGSEKVSFALPKELRKALQAHLAAGAEPISLQAALERVLDAYPGKPAPYMVRALNTYVEAARAPPLPLSMTPKIVTTGGRYAKTGNAGARAHLDKIRREIIRDRASGD